MPVPASPNTQQVWGAQPAQVFFGAEQGPLVGVDQLHPLPIAEVVPGTKDRNHTTITTSTAETTIVPRKVGVFRDLYGLIIGNSSASNVTVTIKDATTGTTILIIAIPANDTRGFYGPVQSAIPQSQQNQNWTATTQSVTSVEITALTVDRST